MFKKEEKHVEAATSHEKAYKSVSHYIIRPVLKLKNLMRPNFLIMYGSTLALKGIMNTTWFLLMGLTRLLSKNV